MLNLDVSHGPTFPRPFHVLDGEDISTSIGIRYDADRMTNREIFTKRLSLTQSSPILNYVSKVEILYDLVGMYSRSCFD